MKLDDMQFLQDYPLSEEDQRAIDNASNGDAVKLSIRLSSCVKAISNINVDTKRTSASQRIGLATYYRRLVSALISCVKDDKIRRSLRTVYMGDDKWQATTNVS